MNITLERQSTCEAKLKVEVPADAVTKERREIVQAFSTQAKIPGFRPGKIPRTVIEKRYGPQITSELEHRLVQKALREAVEKDDLRVLNAKAPEDTVHHPDGALTFSSDIILAPDFDLPQYKGVTLQIPDRQITEEDLAGELENLRNRFADYRDIEDRALQSGDFAVVDYSAQLDGKPLEEALGQSIGYLAGGEDYWLKMEDDALIPGFSQALEGATIDEERDFTLTVPEDFPVEELHGVDLDFHTKIKGIKEQTLPDLDDDLAGQILPGADLAKLKETLRGNLEHQLNKKIEEYKVSRLLDTLMQGLQFELPPELVTSETQGQADEIVEHGLGSGMSEDEIEARQEEIFAAANQRAQSNLRTDFLLQRIAEAEKIAVTQDELANRVAALANQAKKPIKAFAKELQSSGRLQGLRHSMLLSKTIDFLLEHAKLEVVEDERPAESVESPPGAAPSEEPTPSTPESTDDPSPDDDEQ